jgi:hypothetical protein
MAHIATQLDDHSATLARNRIFHRFKIDTAVGFFSDIP